MGRVRRHWAGPIKGGGGAVVGAAVVGAAVGVACAFTVNSLNSATIHVHIRIIFIWSSSTPSSDFRRVRSLRFKTLFFFFLQSGKNTVDRSTHSLQWSKDLLEFNWEVYTVAWRRRSYTLSFFPSRHSLHSQQTHRNLSRLFTANHIYNCPLIIEER